MRFGTGTTVRDFGEDERWLQTAEGLGFDLLTCGDSQSLWAECYSLMTFAPTADADPVDRASHRPKVAGRARPLPRVRLSSPRRRRA